MDEKLKTGTTTVGIVCKEGVVIAADKRATMGYLIANKNVTKLIKITDRIALTIAGGVGDAQMLTKYLKAQMRLYEMRRGQKPTVNACATFLSNILYGGKGGYFPYYVQMVMAGYDSSGFHLFSVGPDGSSIEDNYMSTGSGSVMAYGVLEDNFRDGMSIEEATKLCARAISAAIERDVYTGNGIDIIIIDSKEIKKLNRTEIAALVAKK
jgi:proteasome beta subunit